MFRINIIGACVIFLVFLCACSPQQATDISINPTEGNPGSTEERGEGAMVELTAENNGQIVALVKGDAIRIHLEGNPTTGFNWEAENLDGNLLEMLGKPEFKSSSNLTGAGGEFIVTIKALRAGVTPLRLIYHRPFEKDKSPEKVFEITVEIQE